MRPHLAVAIVQIFTLRLRVQSYGAKVALGLAMLTPLVSAAQIKPRAVVIVAADTVAIWTNTMRVGTLAARDTALAKLAALPVAALPAETQRVLVAELNRVHLALQTGTAVGASEESEELAKSFAASSCKRNKSTSPVK